MNALMNRGSLFDHRLPMEIDQAGAKAKYDHGVLTLTLPKKLSGGSQRLVID